MIVSLKALPSQDPANYTYISLYYESKEELKEILMEKFAGTYCRQLDDFVITSPKDVTEDHVEAILSEVLKKNFERIERQREMSE